MTIEDVRAKIRQPKECDNGDTLSDTRGQRYFRIWDFMLFDFKLEKTELLVYAIIFGIFYSKQRAFYGSREYLMKWTGASKKTVANALNSLKEKKLILSKTQKYRGGVRIIYCTNPDMLPDCEAFELQNKNRDRWANARRERDPLGLTTEDHLKYVFSGWDNEEEEDEEDDLE